MRILYAHPTHGRGEKECIGFVDVEINGELRMYGLRIVRQPDGRHLVYSPQAGHRRTATFGKPLAEQITALALEALEAAHG